MPLNHFAIAYADIEAAALSLEGIARRTPVLTSGAVNRCARAQVFCKAEIFQHVGAFKFRGAYYAVSKLTPEQKRAGVVAFSSGNHAQAVAKACRMLGVTATIVMPHDAPPQKVAATCAYGATIITYKRGIESREEIAGRLSQERGMTLIPPFDHPDIIAGQGTAAKELFEEVGELDYLFVPTGGAGLLAGSAISARALSPNCKVIGVEPEAGNDVQQSFRAGSLIALPQIPDTIADGAQTMRMSDLTWPIVRDLVHDMMTATDDEIREAMRFIFERMNIVVEPTGCLGLAALMQGKIDVTGKRVGIIFSGGNTGLWHLTAG